MGELTGSYRFIKVQGFKGQEFDVEKGGYVSDYNGRGGKVAWIQWDQELSEFVIGATPENGPSYEVLGSTVSFSYPPDQQETM